MLKAARDIFCKIITNLTNVIILEGKVLTDWSGSIIVKGKEDALYWSNYCGLKLSDHVLKVIERVVEDIIGDTVNTDEMQFGFYPAQCTTDAILFLDSFKKSISQNTENCI